MLQCPLLTAQLGARSYAGAPSSMARPAHVASCRSFLCCIPRSLDILCSHPPLVVHLAEPIGRENRSEKGSTRPNLGTHLAESFRDQGLADMKSLSDLLENHPRFVESPCFLRNLSMTRLSHRTILSLFACPARHGLGRDVGLSSFH